MDIRNRNELKQFALERLAEAGTEKKIAGIFAGVVIGLSVVSAIVNYLLGLGIEQTGGLSNMGTRSLLSSVQAMLPFVQMLVLMCMELGYMAAMLRIARGQYASPNTLRLGFDRFWVLLRFTILESALFLGMGFASMYFGVMVFLMTPLSAGVEELLAPVISQMSVLDQSYVVPDAVYDQLMTAMIPAFVIMLVIYSIAAIPLMYRLRMTQYVLIDKPGLGALAAMRQSRMMMRGNCRKLFRLDLSMWWYYAASMAIVVVCYGDVILPMLNVQLPMPREVSFFLFYALYWVGQFAIFYYLRNRVDVTYALTYDAIRPQEQQTGGVVLGNIFQM